jgi:thiol:disulfide interchange protein DsbD
MTQDWVGLAGLFLAGVALNLTPCVYPMLTITVSIFSRTGDRSLPASFLSALVYVLGITVMYSVLGITAALSGGFFGALLQNPWVLLAIAVLMFSMALSMFGLFRVQAPAAVLEKLGRKRAGLGGLFVSGLFVGVFAAPCIGPPVAALLAHVAERQDPVYGFWLFFVMALGLGFPYLLLGTFSHGVKALPKAGAWMLWVDRFFGIVLLGFGAFYLWLAAGSWDLLPVRQAGNGGGPGIHGQAGGLTWKAYTPEALKEALASARPAVLDFYADWCLPCQEMEATTYRNPAVIRAFDRFERIKVDLTDAGNEDQMALAESSKVYGIPTLLFYDSTGNEITSLRATGYVSSKELLAILDQIPSAPEQ